LRHPALDLVIKLAGPEAPVACPFDRMAALHRLMATRTSIPMPEIIAAEVSYRRWPWRYLIKTHIPGAEWSVARHQMNAGKLSSAYRQIGSAVAQVHAIRFPAFGELGAGAQVQTGGPYIDALRTRAAGCIKSTRLRDCFLRVLDRYGSLFQDIHDASLCHEDLHGHNILFENRGRNWHLATILDFDKAWAGHRESDLARMELWKGMTHPGFLQAYEAFHPREPLCSERRPIYQLLWCLEYARPTVEHLADTQRLCRVLGVPIVESFE
jgi:aminoglycoside phosphotransferase (APT) family kinase protein